MKFPGVNEVWSACQPVKGGHSSFLGDLIILQDLTQRQEARKMDHVFSHGLSSETYISC